MRRNAPYAFVWKATVTQPGRARQSVRQAIRGRQGTTSALRAISVLRIVTKSL